MEEDCHYDMIENQKDMPRADHKGTAILDVKTEKDPSKEFQVDKDTSNATILEATENPYYTGLHDINLEEKDINDRIKQADVLASTENPYYSGFDNLNSDKQVIFIAKCDVACMVNNHLDNFSYKS